MKSEPLQAELFQTEDKIPAGFFYRDEIISPNQEKELVKAIKNVTFSDIKMHGVVAKRRTAHFGCTYDFQTFRLSSAAEIPEFLWPLRQTAAEIGGAAAEAFEEALITEYPAGAGIGWHRDAPQFGIVVGVSLLSPCTMQFRPWLGDKVKSRARAPAQKPISRVLNPRSAYVIAGTVREKWQHRIPSTNSLRYSITFRTLRTRLGKS
jgi:alkylated DNA repair dioxygenase AlkB